MFYQQQQQLHYKRYIIIIIIIIIITIIILYRRWTQLKITQESFQFFKLSMVLNKTTDKLLLHHGKYKTNVFIWGNIDDSLEHTENWPLKFIVQHIVTVGCIIKSSIDWVKVYAVKVLSTQLNRNMDPSCNDK